jgi:peptidoglycan hydrolase-like protein with peptidoglycan-binding domain
MRKFWINLMPRYYGLTTHARWVGLLACLSFGAVISAAAQNLTAESINAAPLDLIAASYGAPPKEVDPIKTSSITSAGNAPIVQAQEVRALATEPSSSIARLQILLDRAGASPGVIDGVDGDNLSSAVEAFEIMRGLPADGKIGPQVIGAIENANQVIGTYVITAEDMALVVGPISKDYTRMAEMPFLGYVRASEGLAERFHMDEHFL